MNPTVVNAMSALDVTANQTSAAINTAYHYAASVQVVMTGSSPTGVLKIQASNDNVGPGQAAPSNWTDIASQTVSVSSNTSYLIPKFDIAYQNIRAVYTKTSGTGTITVNIKLS